MDGTNLDLWSLMTMAKRWKRDFGCPGNTCVLSFAGDSVSFTVINEQVELPPALWFRLDGKDLFHCGVDQVKRLQFQKNIWKAVAKLVIQDGSPAEQRLAEKVSSSAHVSVPCLKPNLFHQLTNGFRVCAKFSGLSVFERGLDFTRPDPRVEGGFITTRQERLFWDTGASRLVFTPKGLAKIFFRKHNQEKWRIALAAAIGLTYDEGLLFFSKFHNDSTKPDVVLEVLGSSPYHKPDKETVTRVAFIDVEKPVSSRPIPRLPTVVPPPPPVPPVQGVKQKGPKVELADGDTWLLAEGSEGKSNRARFRSLFPHDWWLRVSERVMPFMNQDASRDVGYRSRSWSQSSLVSDPSEKFDVNAQKYTPPSSSKASGSTPLRVDPDAFRRQLQAKAKKVGATASSRPDAREAYLKGANEFKPEKVSHRKALSEPTPSKKPSSEWMSISRASSDYLFDDDHEDARDSTKSDIETNPGPSIRHFRSKSTSDLEGETPSLNFTPPTPGDVLTVHHPTPPRLRVNHRMNRHTVIVPSPGENTSNWNVGYSSFAWPPTEEHLEPRDSRTADIEENPGPCETLDPTLPQFRGRSGSQSSVAAVTSERSPSRTRRFLGKIGIHGKSATEEVKDIFGFKEHDEVYPYTGKNSSFVEKHYEFHYVLSHLPKDKKWRSSTFIRWVAAASLSELQKSLDCVVKASHPFNTALVSKLRDETNSFFQKISDSEPVGGTTMSALAHTFKTLYACPNNGCGYALEVKPEDGIVLFHLTESPDEIAKNRLWWVLNGNEILHGGDKAPASPSTISFGWLAKEYSTHEVIIEPKPDSMLSQEKPGPFAMPSLSQFQKCVDRIIPTGGHFSRSEVDDLKNHINQYLESTDVKIVDPVLVAAMAMSFKSKFNCPKDVSSFAIDFRLDRRMVVFCATDSPEDKNKGKLYWCIGGSVIVHGGLLGIEDGKSCSPSLDHYSKLWTMPLPKSGWVDRSFDAEYFTKISTWQKALDRCEPIVVFSEHTLQRTLYQYFDGVTDKVLSPSHTAIVACVVKSLMKCPESGVGYAIQFDSHGASLYMCRQPNSAEVNRLWYFHWDFPFVHGGRKSYAPEPRQFFYTEHLNIDYSIPMREVFAGEGLPKSNSSHLTFRSQQELFFGFQQQIDLYDVPTPAFMHSRAHGVAEQAIRDTIPKMRTLQFNFEQVAAIAMCYRSRMQCPCPESAMAVDFDFANERIVFFSNLGSGSVRCRGQMWWCINGVGLVHTGSTFHTYHNQSNQFRPGARVCRYWDEIVSFDLTEFCQPTLDYWTSDFHLQLDKDEQLQRAQIALDAHSDPVEPFSRDIAIFHAFESIRQTAQAVDITVMKIEHLIIMACIYRSKMACPTVGTSMIVKFDLSNQRVRFGVARGTYPESDGRMWWYLHDDCMIHTGRPEKLHTARVEAPLPVSSRFSFRATHRQACEMADGFEKTWRKDQRSVCKDKGENHNHHPLFCGSTFDERHDEVFVSAYIWFYIQLICTFYFSFSRPNLRRRPDGHTEGGEYPVADESFSASSSLLVCKLGTRGDQVPVDYYANVAAHYGVRTHSHVYKDVTTDDLEKMKVGDFSSSSAGYLNLAYASQLGYKRLFTPHVEVERSQGVSYTLSPSSKWVEATRFISDWSKVSWSNFLPAWIATRVTAVYVPTFRIGALSGSDIPRSHDGLNLLEKVKNTAEYEEGWTSGSSSVSVIPDEIKSRCPEIPSGNHLEILKDYKTVHIHGGAGTVQTAIACGARPVIHDKTLDRVYHRMPEPKDFKQPSIGKFMGWLVSAGFKVDAPIEVRAWWLLQWYWSQKWNYAYDALVTLAKAYTICSYVYNHWELFLILFFTVPAVIWRMLFSSKSLFAIVKICALGFWRYPVLCLLDSKVTFVAGIWSMQNLWMGAAQDFAALMETRSSLVWEPVHKIVGTKKLTFPFPLGHWSMKDNQTGKIYEGRFVGPSETIGGNFRLVSTTREYKHGFKSFPAPFNVGHAESLVRAQHVAPYSSSHNCVTMMVQLCAKRSTAWTACMIMVGALTGLALAPPKLLKDVLSFLFPGKDFANTPFYRSLGFAASLENIPLEIEGMLEAAEPMPQIATPEPTDLAHPDSFSMLVDEVAFIQACVEQLRIPTLDKEAFDEVSQRTLEKELDKVDIPEDSLIRVSNIPPRVHHEWAQLVDGLHHAISFVRTNRVADAFVLYVKNAGENVYDFVQPILEILSFFLHLAAEHSKHAFDRLFKWLCDFLDHVWGLEASKRVKTVWGLTGLHRTGLLGVKAKLAANVAYSDFVGRQDFESDYNKLVQEGKHLAQVYGAVKRSNLGGPQRRPIGYGKPLMSQSEASLLGFESGEFVTDREYETRVQSYLEQGVAQGADGVFLADKRPELIAKSQHRYEPKYPALTSEDRSMAKEIAQAMFDQYPEVFANCDVLPPRAVHNYVKQKYSPGTPFIKPGGFKSRQAMFDAGYDRVMQRRAMHYLETGEYPVQFYHAFVKSQVVDIKKCLSPEEGGKGKDVRTVVSQDLFSYYIDQCLQIERNKRINWDTYGAGIGMPLNQSMEAIYNRMAAAQKSRGGRYIIADATAFDSFCKPFLFEVNANLWELGYKDHPSGNGKNLASVLNASYQARQNAWIIGVTEPEYDSLTVCVQDRNSREIIRQRSPKTVICLEDLIDWDKYNRLPAEQRSNYVAKLQPPEGKTVVTWDPALRPSRSNWMGKYEYGVLSDVDKKFFEHQTFTYDPSNFEDMYQDILSVSRSNYKLMSNVHAKNRGGSTGGSDTSNVNTHAFKAGVIYAWCQTTGRAPKEFFQYNDLANTSDDTIWQSGGKHGLNTVEDVEVFRHHCQSVGIHLEIETTKNISQVEYLSKFVRVPTSEDSAALKVWRSQKIKAASNAHKQLGLAVPTSWEQFNNPNFVVVQNPSAILLRRSAFRYYQSNANHWKYVSVERGAGHAQSTAFLPELYGKFAQEWCDDINDLLIQQKIHRKFKVTNGQFGLQCVEQVDPRASQQQLSPRQVAFLSWLRGNMFPSYYRVLDIHMNVAKVDPERHAKFLRKLERGWRGWEELLREGVDNLYALTDSIPDEISKKFQPGLDMLYAEQPFYTKNKVVEKFVYLKLLEESPETEVTFSDFSARIQESPYASVCDPYHFWEKLGEPEFKEQLMSEDPLKIQGLVLLISTMYLLTNTAESVVLAIPFVGLFYKLFLWSFIGLNKVYGLLNTMYWHSEGKSSREISRIMPRDPYMVTKQFAAFCIDFVPSQLGYLALIPLHILSLLPVLFEALGKAWYVAGEVKNVMEPPGSTVNKWDQYADEYIEALRSSPTNRKYVAAKTSTGKSTWFIAALWKARHRQKVRKFWLVEPRLVLRDNTHIPFDAPYQVLKDNIQVSNTHDIHILTYGHLQSRLLDIDNERDIVIFDEFHEQQGEMILGLDKCKAPIFLLSATPAEIPSLHGSGTLVPNIDRRHPIQIHQVDDGMGVVDMFMEAKNRYPDLCKRAMIIVPTHKEVAKVIASLDYLKVGKVSPLSARDRVVQDEGILVCTPYVQTGLDVKPPPDLLIDCGKDFVLDKGRPVFPLPWTDKDINQQRIGRVGRLRPGIVFQPKSAGSGKKGVVYPSPHLFQHKAVAEHFKVPQLAPISGAFTADLPFLRPNKKVLNSLPVEKSVVFIHSLALSGVRQEQWQHMYTRSVQGHTLGNDYKNVDRLLNHSRYKRSKLVSYGDALYHLYREHAVQYGFVKEDGSTEYKSAKPMSVINGKWIELEQSPTTKIDVQELPQQELSNKYQSFESSIRRCRDSIIFKAKDMPGHDLERLNSILAF
uniref:RdRp n=1 Tax=Beticola hypovirus 1 TaxID=2973091 RepID=A0A9E7PRW3_9VIRU|nr:RdRp [Beticola hypovirus 1]